MEDLTETQKAAFQDQLDRASAFEELIRTKGWGYVKAWYQQKIQRFATSILMGDKKPITEFEDERRELIGLRNLLGMIENDMEVARKEYAKKPDTTTKK
jgi:hypothetical protein